MSNKCIAPFNLIHADVSRHASIPTLSGKKKKWFISFIDECTRVTWLFLMKDKSKVFSLFFKFYHMVQTQFGKPIKRLRSDNGREYANQDISIFLRKYGILYELTFVDTPQQNGVS